MQNTQVTQQKANLTAQSQQLSERGLRENAKAQEQLDGMLLSCFAVQKMYGRAPENLEAINQIFHRLLADHPGNLVIKAFETWMRTNQEFPTPADIIGLVERRGGSVIGKEVYIAKQKLDPELRTPDDWKTIRDYEKQNLNTEWGSDIVNPNKTSELRMDNENLRKKVSALTHENAALRASLHEKKMAELYAPRTEFAVAEHIEKTIAYLKSKGASEEEIESVRNG